MGLPPKWEGALEGWAQEQELPLGDGTPAARPAPAGRQRKATPRFGGARAGDRHERNAPRAGQLRNYSVGATGQPRSPTLGAPATSRGAEERFGRRTVDPVPRVRPPAIAV
jgi:hypothetical protein